MINYRNTSIVWLLVTLVFILSGLNFNLLYGYGFLTLIYIVFLVIGSIKINWNFYFKSRSHGKRQVSEIALTFDDGPDESKTIKILDILKKHNIEAAFFSVGNKIEKNISVFNQIVEAGHIIGNHSYSHSFWFDFYSPARMVREINRTDQLIQKYSGKKSLLFRPPYGVTNPFLSKALKKTGHISVSWSLRSFDTTKKKDDMMRHLKRRLKDGDIILFHDTSKVTAEVLEDFINFIKKKGKKIVGLDKLLKISAYDS